jgi:DNA-binding phage protein
VLAPRAKVVGCLFFHVVVVRQRANSGVKRFSDFSLALKSEIIVQGGMANHPHNSSSRAGISRTHAYDILAGREEPSLAVALRIYDATGAQFGILKGLAQDTIKDLRKQAA